ncbi:hypothetical protein RQP54_17625 [Curvibacter sp. APW13]|uniref:hypothetical protein n=1 Tax=Curvibacter sp. APW13 TaxID=3077236 RepID=UPI0028DFA727|nr:hypothetical protein [Curvibacter sp. APW13]MDT8992696.1 hypothetical protein [Curvibacter sp. APW13]
MATVQDLMASIKGHNAPTLIRIGEGQELVFEAQALKNTRDLRFLMVEAAYALNKAPDLQRASIAVKTGSTLSQHAIQTEIQQFLALCQPPIANRLQIVDLRTKGSDTHYWSNEVLSRYLDESQPPKPTKASQEAVIATLLQRYLRGNLPGLSLEDLAKQTGAGIATVYLAIQRYQTCIERTPHGGKMLLRLHHFTRNDWRQWIERSNRLSSVHFIDRSGMPRSATRLAKALARLQRDDLAIGGMMGAMHHLPALDATAAPQLDILLHGSPRADLSFIEQIDPGLKLTKDPHDPAHVVVHFIDRPQSLFEREGEHNWGALPDCIANMQRARQTHQVEDAINLIRQAHQAETNGTTSQQGSGK